MPVTSPKGSGPTVLTSLFASSEDWSDPALNKRIDRAALDLVLLMESGFAQQVRDESWRSHQYEFGSAGGTEVSIDLDSDLMRLATGGSANGNASRTPHRPDKQLIAQIVRTCCGRHAPSQHPWTRDGVMRFVPR
jgi:hypothetical protein